MPKTILMASLLLAGTLFLTACGTNVPDSASTDTSSNQVSSAPIDIDSAKEAEDAHPQRKSAAKSSVREVIVSFDMTTASTPASNQIACWIEDESGNMIRTIYVSDFAGVRRGYAQRKEAVPHWVAAANPSDISDSRMDAISGATPQSGRQTLSWNLKDDNGEAVPAGRYQIFLEGTLYWSSDILFSGTVDTRKAGQKNINVSKKRSQPNETQNENMLQNVSMKAIE